MRDYSMVAPQFWIGKTGRALKAKGSEAVLVALYLMTCQHANMIGLYYLNKSYIAVDTGLTLEGASKGLQGACEVGFCSYDEGSEVVWVHEMAKYQVGGQLQEKDNRCKGVQRAFNSVAENPFLTSFYKRYGRVFHMTDGRQNLPLNTSPIEAPLKALKSQEQEQEQEQEGSVPIGTAGAASAPIAGTGLAETPPSTRTPAQRIADAAALPALDELVPLGELDEKTLWSGCRALLAEAGVSDATAGNFIGGLIKKNDNNRRLVFEVMQAACVERPIDPRGWMTAACQQRTNGRLGSANKQTQLEDSNHAAALSWLESMKNEN